jgi:uncharacterized membrane protein YbaN (DUF454 family)
MKKILFLIAGHFFLALGLVGAILPILPTTPFLLLAVFFYSKSNSKLHSWLMNNKYFGPSLKEWFVYGVIRTKAKIIATVMVSFIIFWKIPRMEILIYGKILIEIVLTGVLIFIWTRPSGNQL